MKKFIRRSSSLAAVSFEHALRSETQAPLEGAENMGCPDEYSCNSRCRALGKRGGYCNLWTLRQVCVCYK